MTGLQICQANWVFCADLSGKLFFFVQICQANWVFCADFWADLSGKMNFQCRFVR